MAKKGRTQVVDKPLSAYLSEAYLTKWDEEIVPHILREGRWQGETVIAHHGESFVVLQDSFLVRDEQGDPAYVAMVMADITDRKRAEEALRQSYEEHRAIYDGMFEGLVILDSETKQIVRVNASLCRMLGYTEEELLSMSITDIHPANEAAATLARVQSRAAGNAREDTNVPFLRKDGSVFYADITGNSLTYGGRPSVLGLFRDITERKQSLEALQREHRTLKHLLQSSDHERQLIAYEIHDGLAQQLAGAIMQFQDSTSI